MAAAGRRWAAGGADAVQLIDAELRPRWVVWSGETAAALAASGVRLATCWDISAVHRLLFGGWRADPGWAWAHLHDLAPATIPARRGRPGRSVRAGRGRRPRRSGAAGRPPAAGLGERWLGGQPSTALPLGGAGRHGGRAAAGGAGPAGGPADGPGHGAIRIYGRIAVRGTVGRRAADGPVRRRGGPGGVRRPAPAHRGRGGQEPGGARRWGAAARTAGGRRRFAQPGPGAHPTGPGGRGCSRHPGVAAAHPPRRSSAGRRAAGVAQGGTDRHHLRLRVAGHPSRSRRPATWHLDRIGWRGRPDDRLRRPAQHARP